MILSELLLSIMKNPIFKYVMLFLVIVLSMTGAYHKGKYDEKKIIELEIEEQKEKWETRLANIQTVLNTKIATLMSEYKETKENYQKELEKLNNSKTKEKVITVYIPKKDDIIVNKGFVDLHNTAVKGLSLSDQNVGSSDPTNVRLSDVGLTIANNYYTCNYIREQLITLQNVVSEYQNQQEELIK